MIQEFTFIGKYAEDNFKGYTHYYYNAIFDGEEVLLNVDEALNPKIKDLKYGQKFRIIREQSETKTRVVILDD